MTTRRCLGYVPQQLSIESALTACENVTWFARLYDVPQSALLVAIFYGNQIIWERDGGVLTKLMVTPTLRAALVTGKAFAADIRAVAQAVVVVVVAALLGVSMTWNPLELFGVGSSLSGAPRFLPACRSRSRESCSN